MAFIFKDEDVLSYKDYYSSCRDFDSDDVLQRFSDYHSYYFWSRNFRQFQRGLSSREAVSTDDDNITFKTGGLEYYVQYGCLQISRFCKGVYWAKLSNWAEKQTLEDYHDKCRERIMSSLFRKLRLRIRGVYDLDKVYKMKVINCYKKAP